VNFISECIIGWHATAESQNASEITGDILGNQEPDAAVARCVRWQGKSV
tara:strand:- start:11474 stop:11620 length:147 start_codon:yes stop_codon:yes gene_type:complete